MAASQILINAPANKRKGKFSYLFFAQVLLLVISPYLEKPGLPVLALRLIAAAACVAAVYAVSEKRLQWVTALVLAVPAAALNAVSAFRPDFQVLVPALVATILFLAYTMVTLLRAVLRAGTVTKDTIYGAVSVYLLMAFLWSAGYMLLETVHPGALAMNVSVHGDRRIDWSDCIFYSFVTLTSLGYGDIVPATPHSRSLSIMEAISGIMYVAILIARLVSLYSVANAKREP